MLLSLLLLRLLLLLLLPLRLSLLLVLMPVLFASKVEQQWAPNLNGAVFH